MKKTQSNNKESEFKFPTNVEFYYKSKKPLKEDPEDSDSSQDPEGINDDIEMELNAKKKDAKEDYFDGVELDEPNEFDGNFEDDNGFDID